jgi:hypothetical protein
MKLLALLILCLPALAGRPENLAPRASITADSQYNKAYRPSLVADGMIPGELSRRDVGEAWCVQGNTHRQGAELILRWPKAVKIAELHAYGRSAWYLSECWKDYEIYLDDQPVMSGQLEMRHGLQRITLKTPQMATTLRLRFTSSYGGPNPGLSELQVYSEPVVDHSAKLAERVYAGELGFREISLIQRHSIRPSHVYTYHAEGLQPGGGLYLMTLDGKRQLRQLIDSSEGVVLDSNVSYDGKRILFSWKRSMEVPFQVYTINTDGSDLQQISTDDSNNMNACWLPDGGIAFLSDRKPAFAYCWTTTSPVLYRSAADGSAVQRLSANYLNDFTPSVMRDGRIIYSRWEYVDRPAIPIQSLWTINQDGTGLAGFFGNRVLSPATFMEAREIPGTSKVLCVLTAHNGPCRGAIGIVDVSKGANTQAAITNITPEVRVDPVDRGAGNNVRGPYESPFPLDDSYYLVSRDGTIQLRDYANSETLTLLPRQTMGFYSPQPLRATPRPPSHPSIRAQSEWGTLLLQDVYNGLEPHVKRGEIAEIAVVQEVEKSKRADKQYRAFGFQFPVVSCGATYAPKKVWGYAKVEADGSAHFKVPAGLPIYFMALDKHGRALQRMRTFTHLMPGETQSCVGCHADRNYASPSITERPLAAQRQPQDLSLPDWGLGGFSYAHTVQPVLDAHCVSCHNAKEPGGDIDLSGDQTDFFNVSYEVLAREGPAGKNRYTKWIPTYNGQEANILQVTPRHWGSPASLLADLILSGHPDAEGKPRVQLSAAEQRRIFTWIDLDVPYYGSSESQHYTRPGCRQMLPSALEATLKDVSARRCVSCHEAIPRKEWVRVGNPQFNTFLLGPLAKSAGGSERCGKPVFENTDDPDYQAILDTFREVTDLLKETPRIDSL